MSPEAAENSSVSQPPKYTFDPARPWPWVSYEDPAWPLEPWDVMDHEDLADATVRFAIRLLSGSTEGMSVCEAAALVEDAAKRVAADVVAEARTQRYSWGRIAAQFGVGRTAVQKRFGRWPSPERARTLEDQYVRMGHFLKGAELNPDMNEDEYMARVIQEARETRSRCIRRRRGHVINPLDRFHKVVTSRRGQDQSK
ncbi:hypothetical protein [Streptomyces vastus]|uniref:Sigma-70 family RNA polymerase sigma factor n=1 Tax=Streptomyces vastus TaxID=285451 RepID=A0ABN3RAQ9_9ACTN